MKPTSRTEVQGLADALTLRAGSADDAPAAFWILSSRPTAVPIARHLTRVRLQLWRLPELVEAAELLVSELVTNAVRHAGGHVRLTLTVDDGLMRCEVEDGGPLLLPAEGWYGRALLDALACCWGTGRTDSGEVVWFEIPTADRTRTEPVRG
ncbi:ATP-binding protein [Nonomuraea sp. NPDC003804]|uniref:ATP-binding protein n=1 Tax=Nonomuraea sp. NPDC003804 TaxID=3154547 RepID=UPI0033A50AC1